MLMFKHEIGTYWVFQEDISIRLTFHSIESQATKFRTLLATPSTISTDRIPTDNTE